MCQPAIPLFSLTVDAAARPTPREMLKHPWIVSQQSQKANMEKWLAQVWGWPLPPPASQVDGNTPSSTSSSTAAGNKHHHHKKNKDKRSKHRSGTGGSGDHSSVASSLPTGVTVAMRPSMSQGSAAGSSAGGFEGSSGGSLLSPDSPRPPF